MSTKQMDWDKLRVFGVVSELKSLTAAAKRLGESTPTVSRKIVELEKTLNCQLLVRTTQGVELTEAGRLAAKHILAINDEANTLWNDVANFDIEGGGNIRMIAQDGVASHWLTRFLPSFQRDNPHVEFDFKIQEREPDLLTGEADVTISFSEPRHRELQSIRLGVLHYMFFASQDYLDRRGTPQSLFDLDAHDCLAHDSYVHQVERWSSRGANLKKSLHVKMQTNSGTVLKEVCANGGGVALMPSYVAEIDRRLIALQMPEIAPIQFWLVYTQRLQRLSRGRRLVDWVRRQFAGDEHPWFRETFIHPDKVSLDNRLPVAAAKD
ncbi:LysR family transcriptional regulator [Henriciella litoralis]|uniref:LysR family transcriptional regulator n=1 Tax=Henriciella litoralis TaxID=568102 RepID=UPI000A015FB1|nr:LysR family transcriptional regulator [Henriciella litoralis]